MSNMKNGMLLMLLVSALTACGNNESTGSAAGGGDVKAIEFVTTQDSSPLKIDPALFDTPAAKEFLATGKNPYIGNAEAIAKGKKCFSYIPAHNVTVQMLKVK